MILCRHKVKKKTVEAYSWSEFLELGHPVGDSGERHANEEGARNPQIHQMRHKSYALDGLSQTHFISQDPINAILKQ